MTATSPLKVQPADSRTADRRVLRLLASGRVECAELQLEMYNISHTGFLAKVTGDLQVDQILDVELPAGGSRKARSVWLNEGLAGFTFLEPISSAMMSSASLKGEFTQIVRSAEWIREPDLSSEISEQWNDHSSPEKFSPQTRLLILLSLAIVSWAVAIGVIRLLF